MANYHFEVKIVSRGKGESVVDRVAYILREKLRDSYTGRIYSRRSKSEHVPVVGIRLPDDSPSAYADPQVFLDALNVAERRSDAQMARSYILSLPNELTLDQQVKLSTEFIDSHFTREGQGTIYAIHCNPPNTYGRGNLSPRHGKVQDNPHLHIIVPFRKIDSNGFQATKLGSRATNNRTYLKSLRKDWADEQNRMYEQQELNIRVSHESLAMQGIHQREVPCLTHEEFELERNGISTLRGNDYRKAIEENARLYPERFPGLGRKMEHTLSPTR